ncbi:MAG: hypothetical protein ACM3ZE_17740 [Myxococcales bacterium]
MDQGITALVVTHDRWFLDRVATSILAFEGNGRVVLYPGNFDTYRRLKAESRQAELELAANVERESKPKAAQTDAPRKPRKIALNFKEGRELAELPDAIEQTEAQIAACNARLCDPNTYTQSASEVPAIQADLESLRGKLEQQMARWEELERKKSEANPG